LIILAFIHTTHFTIHIITKCQNCCSPRIWSSSASSPAPPCSSIPQHFQEFSLTDCFKEVKAEKKTNDEEEPTEPVCKVEFKDAVRTSTIEELDFEYNRLWSMEGENYNTGADFDALKLGQSALEWDFEKEEKGISWLDFD
jgi:hypothetical protein